MKTKFVFNLFFLIFFIVIIFTATAQQCTQTLNISNSDYHGAFPDICLDYVGFLHCVWLKKFESNHRCVYYKRSSDQGEHWLYQTNVSNNQYKAVGGPQIVSDSQNNLYVVYEYDLVNPAGVKLFFQKYDGTNSELPSYPAN